jgi:hypothetical protein
MPPYSGSKAKPKTLKQAQGNILKAETKYIRTVYILLLLLLLLLLGVKLPTHLQPVARSRKRGHKYPLPQIPS